jgi:hypothetical protein
MASLPTLLSDPFLQLPTASSVQVVWFTEFEGSQHWVSYGSNLEYKASATTTKLSRLREDQDSRVGQQTQDGQVYPKPTIRNIWRHEASVTELKPGQRLPYRVISMREDGQWVNSDRFTLSAQPALGQPLKILLTSDHQLKPMVAANLQKVTETIDAIDAVFLAGDLINIPDRASEWFDDNRGGAFFPALQGRANYELGPQDPKPRYQGGAIIQSAPLFPAIGNHEVMGRFSTEASLGEQFDDTVPREAALKRHQQTTSNATPPDPIWLKDQSFNTDTYEAIFSLPTDGPAGKQYYAVTVGDVRLVVLYITNMWRSPSLGADVKGKYQERQRDLNDPTQWGHGQVVFGAISKGTPQYNWLQSELGSPAFKQARYKVVMFHHPAHSLGENVVPAYTEPKPMIERGPQGNIQSVRYEYPVSEDYIIRDVIPLLESADVQLVFYGHTHIWNRFTSATGMHFLESSNVGNSYGAYVGDKRRQIPEGYQEQYAAIGDANGLEPILPTLAPLMDQAGNPMPYLSSNEMTAFSILDTRAGTVSSYRFDTRQPESAVIKFDEFKLK